MRSDDWELVDTISAFGFGLASEGDDWEAWRLYPQSLVALPVRHAKSPLILPSHFPPTTNVHMPQAPRKDATSQRAQDKESKRARGTGVQEALGMR